ncbi:hypothetical protein [Lysinibacillus xylanilyticus]|uniref:hypothetical protein n=1 Tax=Lysinibacillus xylanilyticus TaxID=582475 RepID=UPI003D072357
MLSAFLEILSAIDILEHRAASSSVALLSYKKHIAEILFYHYKLEYHARRLILSEMVDWSGDWATPWGSASQMRPWSEQSE